MPNTNHFRQDSEPAGNESISLDDLVVLNDEIAAAVRAGLPIETGWNRLGRRLPDRLRRLTDRLSERMNSGSSFAEAISAEEENLPGMYRAVVGTGLRSGRLADALQSLSGLAKSERELRRQVRLALIYPAAVVVLAYLLLIAFMLFMVPQFNATWQRFRLPRDAVIAALDVLSETVLYWGPALPITVLVVLYASTIRRASRTAYRDGSRGAATNCKRPTLTWIPGLSRVMRDQQWALFCDMMALLVEHAVPLHEAFRLAGESTGDPHLTKASAVVASRLQAGESLAQAMNEQERIPAYMKWNLHMASLNGYLAVVLRRLAEHYRARAMFRAGWYRLLLPVVATAVVAGGITALYALTLFVPVTRMLYDMGNV